MLDKMGSGFKDYAPFVLRLGLATIFIIQGAEHLTHLGSSPRAGHIVVAVVEILGGLFALIGFLTRWAGAALFALMIWRIIEGPGVRAFTQESHQLYFAVLMMSFALFGLGGGKWSVDASSKKKDQ